MYSMEHIILYHNCPYHILVHIQLGETTTHEEQRLLKCVENAQDKKEKAKKEHDLLNCKAKDFKWLLAPGIEMSYEELEDLINEIEDYKQQMVQAKKQMESSSVAFLSAHATTMEVLGMVGKVQYHEWFHKDREMWDVCSVQCLLIVMNLGTKHHQLPLDGIWSYCQYFW